MQPRPRTSPRAPSLAPLLGWLSHQSMPFLASFKLNYMFLYLWHAFPRGPGPGSIALRVYPSPDLFLNRWVWSDLSSEALLLIPLEARISDVKRAEA